MLKNNMENTQADVVVIGGGGAGLPAAIAAAEQGIKNVIVIEKRRKMGGNGVFPAGIFATGSRLQKSLGIDARNEEVFKEVMAYTHWKANPRLVRTLLNRSGDTIAWLEEKGVKFTGVVPHYPNQAPAFFHVSSGPEATGAAITKALTRSGEALGVRFIGQSAARKIIRKETGELSSVIVKVKDQELLINTKSIIIATGGFAGNTRLLKKHVPGYEEMELLGGGLAHQGDGLRLASEVGAASEGMATLEMAAPFAKLSRYTSPLIKRPSTIWVNRKGTRFADETIVHFFSEAANTVYRQPGRVSFTLFDETIKEKIIHDGLGVFEEFTLGKSPWRERVYQDIQADVAQDKIKVSRSWDEIAAWMAVSPPALKATIEEYNSCCDRGYDNIFAKERRYLMPLRTPPYYAIKCGLGLVTTHGGIKINHLMEVLDNQDNPIPGLYAAGVETGGTDSDTYNVGLSGHSYGFSVNSGRIAGENAAKYILQNK